MTEVVNLRPFDVTILDANGEVIVNYPAPKNKKDAASVASYNNRIGYIGDTPLTITEYGDLRNLPDPTPGKVFVVPYMVADVTRGTRDDVFIPNGAVRDADGNIIGFRSLHKV